MNVGIVGSTGYIAGYLIRYLEKQEQIKTIIKIDRSDSADFYLDLSQSEQFHYEKLKGIDYIIFTAAISGPDQCASEFDACWKINVEGTGRFIDEALNQGCRVLFFSSDAVYGDVPGKTYTEDSETKAETPYGRMKKAIEDRFWSASGFKAIRLSYVVSQNDKFVSYCLNCMGKGEEAEIFHPFYRNCVVVTDVVNTVDWLIRHWDQFPSMVLNVAGRELVSRVRIVDEINRLCTRKLRYRIVTPDESFYQNRPKITQMESKFLGEYKILENNSFSEKIQKELEEYINE